MEEGQSKRNGHTGVEGHSAFVDTKRTRVSEEHGKSRALNRVL